MGVSERKKREKLKRANDIIDAAERVFFKNGFEKATMDDIAAEAELSKGTLYLYFDTKESLYAEIGIRGNDILYNISVKAFELSEKGMDKLIDLGRVYYEYYKNYRDYFDAMNHQYSSSCDVVEKELGVSKEKEQGNGSRVEKDAFTLVIDAVEAGISDGSIRKDADPVVSALLAWAELNGVIWLLRSREGVINDRWGIDGEDIMDTFFENTRKSLTPQ